MRGVKRNHPLVERVKDLKAQGFFLSLNGTQKLLGYDYASVWLYKALAGLEPAKDGRRYA